MQTFKERTMKYISLNQQEKVILEIGFWLLLFTFVCIFTGVVFSL